MKSKIMPTVVLVTICVIVALSLAAVNMLTEPIIEKANADKVQATLAKVLPTGKNFIEVSNEGLAAEILNVYAEDNGGYVFTVEVTGYKSGLVIMCGVTPEGKIAGAEVINSSETLSAEKELGAEYIGKDKSNLTPEIVSSATLTSNAYFKAIDLSLKSYEILTEKEGAK
jgi:electron transport complex protein RnfG